MDEAVEANTDTVEVTGLLEVWLRSDPGGVVAAAVEDVADGGRLASHSDEVVLLAAAAAQRVATWALSRAALLSAELAERWDGAERASGETSDSEGGEGAARTLGWRAGVAEVALASGLSEYAVAKRIAAKTFAPGRVPGCWAAFCGGRLEWARLDEVLTQTAVLDAEHAQVVDGLVLDTALRGNLPQLRALLKRVVGQVDPAGADERAERARHGRGVTKRAGRDGMATLSVTASADAITDADAMLTVLARLAADGEHDPDNSNSNSDSAGGSETLTGRAHTSTKADVLLDLIAGAGRDLTSGCRPGTTDEGNVTDPDESPDEGPDEGPDGGPDQDTPRAADARDEPRSQGQGSSPVRTVVIVTVPLTTALGLASDPGEISGLGPIPGELARRIAHEVALGVRDGYWRCAFVEDRDRADGALTHGTLLGLGRSTFTPRYTPTAATRRFVTIRDRVCSFPGCRRRADTPDDHHRRIDVDHRDPWRPATSPLGGTGATCECTLQALCRGHHRLKHHVLPDGRRYRVRASGRGKQVVHWTTPSGRVYRRAPEPLPTNWTDPEPRAGTITGGSARRFAEQLREDYLATYGDLHAETASA